MEETLNLDYYYKDYSIKALNRTNTFREASELLGISERTLLRWRIQYNIIQDPKTKRYGETIQGARVAEKIR